MGAIHRKLDRTDEAVKEFQEAIRCNPGMIAVYTNIAEIHVAAGRVAEGLALAQRAADVARSKDESQTAAEIERWIKSRQTAKERDER